MANIICSKFTERDINVALNLLMSVYFAATTDNRAIYG